MMIELLLRLFIKDYKETKNERIRAQYGFLGASFGILTNLILFVSKMIIGVLTANLSIIADALNNMSDFGSCFLTVFGFRMSSKPADADHPYGHERMEYIVSIILASIMVALGVSIGYSAVLSIITPEAELTSFPWISIIILAAGILIKAVQSYVYYSLAERIDSIALKASGADARNDVLVTASVLSGLLVSYYTGFTRMDGILALIVSLFIIYTGIKILIDTSNILLGERPSEKTVARFVKIIKSHKEVRGVHDIEMHSYGPNSVFASAHVEVDGSVDIFATHDAIDNIETECYKKLGIRTVIHMDPIKVNDPKTDYCRSLVAKEVYGVDRRLSIHDFRIVSGPTHTNVVFDMVVPFDLKKDKNRLLRDIRSRVMAKDPSLRLVVNLDDQYTMLSKDND